jgi:hypothetical protein
VLKGAGNVGENGDVTKRRTIRNQSPGEFPTVVDVWLRFKPLTKA